MKVDMQKLTHYSPGDGPLLSTDKTTTLRWRRELGYVDRDLGRADTDAQAVDNSANDEHGDVL